MTFWQAWVFCVSCRDGLTDAESARIAEGWALLFLAVGLVLAASWINSKIGDKNEEG